MNIWEPPKVIVPYEARLYDSKGPIGTIYFDKEKKMMKIKFKAIFNFEKAIQTMRFAGFEFSEIRELFNITLKALQKEEEKPKKAIKFEFTNLTSTQKNFINCTCRNHFYLKDPLCPVHKNNEPDTTT